LLPLVAGMLAGCGGPKTADVSGTITLKGKAPDLEGLHINFLGDDGQTIAAKVDRDGTFRARGIPLGKVQVGLAYLPPEVAKARDQREEARTKRPEEAIKGPDGKVDPRLLQPQNREFRPGAFKNPIPQRLWDPRTSGKAITVEAGRDNVLIWDIPL
jgi:hypothetical protein